MGDLLMTLPLVKSLKVDFPDCHVTMLCYQEFSQLLDDCSDVDRTLKIRVGEIRKLAEFGENDDPETDRLKWPELYETYHMVINLAYDVWPAKLTSKLSSANKYGRVSSKKDEVRLLGDWMKYLFSIIHHRDYGLIAMADVFIRSCGLKSRDVSAGGFLKVPPEAEDAAATLLKENGWQGGQLVCIQLGASEAIRTWGLDRFVGVCAQIKAFDKSIEIVISGSENEIPLARSFLDSVDFPVINLVGRTNILDVPAVLKQCRLLISSDTGPIHIAAAVETSVLTVTFASAYFAETGPYGNNHYVIQSEVPCTPCTDYHQCPYNMKCRDFLTVEAASAVARWILGDAAEFTFDYPNLTLYRSGFIAGSLFYAPVFPENISHHYILGLLYRVMWEAPTDIPVYHHRLYNEASAILNSQQFTQLFAQFCTELTSLQEIFTIGVAACRALNVCFRSGNVSQEAIAQPLSQLNIIESFLGKREEPLSPLKHFFSFVMMDMDYLQFPELAVELEKKYARLRDMTHQFLENLHALKD